MKIHRRVLVGLVMAASVTLAASAASAHVFRFRAQGAQHVSVAGSFNGWSTTANPLADADGDGVWEADVDLRPGSYQYKFVVNGTDWKVDPENPKKAPDGLGGENSVVEITASGGGAAAAPAAASAGSGTLFSVEAPGAQKVELYGSWNGWSAPTAMTRGTDGVTWSTTMTLQPGRYEYKFMKDGDWDALNKDNRSITVP